MRTVSQSSEESAQQLTTLDSRIKELSQDVPTLVDLSGPLVEEGWRACHTDGTGRAGHHASAFYTEDRRGNPPLSRHAYLGEESTVADAERKAIVEALAAHRDITIVAILSDSQSAISSALNISLNHHQARSTIETELVDLLGERHNKGYDATISWVRAHIGVNYKGK
ncbi:hypothetical protein EV426DRAFT_705569 [Tirmania nivea]|nr:hypothetical protein EV426DRAFT_705569 [Tirmania nivea]